MVILQLSDEDFQSLHPVDLVDFFKYNLKYPMDLVDIKSNKIMQGVLALIKTDISYYSHIKINIDHPQKILCIILKHYERMTSFLYYQFSDDQYNQLKLLSL